MTAVTERKRPVLVFLGLIAASLGALLLLPPILQDQSYHRFANKRTLLGVQNFWNVVSNFPFIAIGAVGLRQFYRDPATIALFLGLFLTAFGSSYYHWNPNDDTLFWDRLPMTLCFMAILAAVIDERVNVKFVLWPLLATGILIRCCGGGPAISDFTAGCNSFPVSRYLCYSWCFRPDIPGRSIGSSPCCCTRSLNCSSSPITQFIAASSSADNAQTSLRGCGLFRDTQIFPETPAHCWIVGVGGRSKSAMTTLKFVPLHRLPGKGRRLFCGLALVFRKRVPLRMIFRRVS